MPTAPRSRQRTRVGDLLDTLPRRVPRATYRLQFHAGFTFADAEKILDYLNALGVSDVYASPLLMARQGSPHGYDITDHNHFNPDLGGDEGFDRFSQQLHHHDLGLLLDVVPNHMGIGDVRNLWWMDVLENGPSSIYAGYFDIDWDPVPDQLHNKVLLPILGDQYGNVLERGELKLHYGEGSFFIRYWEHHLPICPGSYGDLLAFQLDDLIENAEPDNPDLLELQSIITALKYLPPQTSTDPDLMAERAREKEIVKQRIHRLVQESPTIYAAIEHTVATYNGDPDDPRSFDLLDGLIEQQPYRLAFWRVATEEINYRRFFDINDLAAIRVELPEVLQATHQLIFRVLAEGRATGLRIDHPDGLWNPPGYFRQLQENYLYYWVTAHLAGDALEIPEELGNDIQEWIDQAVLAPNNEVAVAPKWPLYVVAEKILAHNEQLPDNWAVDGTTGYDFLNELNGLFVERDSRRAFDRIYTDVTGPQWSYANLVNSKKKEIMLVSLASEINTLSHLLDQITEHTRRYRDFTLNSLTFALREVIACLPVYRTYISDSSDSESLAEWEQRFIESAVKEARRRNPRTAEEIFTFIRDTLLLRNLESFAEEARPEVFRCVMKFQQIAGPVMAKGVEDTAFYVYNRLVSLNEVGGHPDRFGESVEDFHKHAVERSRRWPHAMLTTSTHDTKRSEDVRARINVLSEIPREWRQMVGRWSKLNARKKNRDEDTPAPHRNDEYLLYQTLVGAWPTTTETTSEHSSGMRDEELEAYRDRIARYMEKATREAKVNTSWISPNEAYDSAVQNFVAGILNPRRSKRFLESLASFSRRVAFFGHFNALAQTLLKLTSPGLPDIYQGCELWDLSLVDPDNRRPVDFALRRTLLQALEQRIAHGNLAELADELVQHAADGRIKLYLTRRTLALRAAYPDLFAGGEYLPLTASGEHANHVVAFARRYKDQEIVVVVPRLTLILAGGEERAPLGTIWSDTRLELAHSEAGVRYRECFSGEEVPATSDATGQVGLSMSALLAHFPVALLERI
jgi:(1->4)-alpha-D-glucan 1-alpha-D-glucosylmutase